MVNPYVCSEVNESRWVWDSDTKTTAHGLKSSLQSVGVIVGFTVLKNSLDHLKGLSAKLQRRDIGVFEVYTMIDNIKSDIQCLKDDIDVEFERWYDEAKQPASYIGTKEEIPRVHCGSNVPAANHYEFCGIITVFCSSLRHYACTLKTTTNLPFRVIVPCSAVLSLS